MSDHLSSVQLQNLLAALTDARLADDNDLEALTALAALKPDKPAGMPTSLTRVRTVTKPKMPSKPKLESMKPQSKLETQTELLKENEHALS